MKHTCEYGYTLHPHEPGYAMSAGFIVQQADEILGIPDFTPDCGLNEHRYRYLHAFNIAASLSALTNEDMPGQHTDGIYYYVREMAAEYSDKQQEMNIISLLQQRSEQSGWDTNQPLRILEIGGQEGSWMTRFMMEFRLRQHQEIHADIIDLDFERRMRVNLFGPDKNIRYFQGDAHHLSAFDLPAYHSVCFNNVTHVLYDPIHIMAQAWEKLVPGGVLIVNGTGSRVSQIPVWIDGPGAESEDYQAFPIKDNLQNIWNTWKQQEAQLYGAIPGDGFSFDTKHRNVQQEDISRIAELIYKLPDRLPHFKLYSFPLQQGYTIHTMFSSQSVAFAVEKNSTHSEKNPFLLPSCGTASSQPHVGEYVFPQNWRYCKLA